MSPEVEKLLNMAAVGRGEGRVIVDDLGTFEAYTPFKIHKYGVLHLFISRELYRELSRNVTPWEGPIFTHFCGLKIFTSSQALNDQDRDNVLIQLESARLKPITGATHE